MSRKTAIGQAQIMQQFLSDQRFFAE